MAIAAVDNDVFAWDKIINVTAAATSGTDTTETVQSLTIEEDDPRPVVTVALSADSITENGGTATITAELDRSVAGNVYVRLTVEPVAPTGWAEYEVNGSDLTVIRAGQTKSTSQHELVVTARDDILRTGDKTLRVTGRLHRARDMPWLQHPVRRTLTITEDDPADPTGICDRADEVQYSMFLFFSMDRITDETDCAAITAEDVAALKRLRLIASRAYMPLVPGDLAWTDNLQHLDIYGYWRDPRIVDWSLRPTYNALTYLHPRVFTGGLQSLRKLEISHFDAIRVPAELFAPAAVACRVAHVGKPRRVQAAGRPALAHAQPACLHLHPRGAPVRAIGPGSRTGVA